MASVRAHLICLGLLVCVVAVINAADGDNHFRVTREGVRHTYRVTSAPTIHRRTNKIPGTRTRKVHRHEHPGGSVTLDGAGSNSAADPSDGSYPDSGEAPPIPVPTPSPDTPAPATPAPDTPAQETPAPATEAPETPTPATESPATEAPETPAPETPAPETPAPETPAPATDAPATESPGTEAPATDAPEIPAPDTEAPETPAPENGGPATPAPEGTTLNPNIHRHTVKIPGRNITHSYRYKIPGHRVTHHHRVKIPGSGRPKQVPSKETPDDAPGVYYLINLIYNYFSVGGKLTGVPPVDLLLLRYYVAQGPKKFCNSV